jgi:hypothetical protein
MYKENHIKFQEIEKKFAESVKIFSKVEYSTKDQDIYEHWDVKMSIKVDVKAMKKINRSDEESNENIHYVELKNVHGNNGWLYGDADYFAFETEDYFVMVSKVKLQEFIANKCRNKQLCDSPELYKLYTRKDRMDVITLVKTIDLLYLSDKIVKKDGN